MSTAQHIRKIGTWVKNTPRHVKLALTGASIIIVVGGVALVLLSASTSFIKNGVGSNANASHTRSLSAQNTPALNRGGQTVQKQRPVDVRGFYAANHTIFTNAACYPLSSSGSRPISANLYGVTEDGSGSRSLSVIVAGLKHFSKCPTTRIYFDPSQSPQSYSSEIESIVPHSYIMGELLDSSDETAVSTSALRSRTQQFVNLYSNKVDIWEIGNEVNGNWTGPYPKVETKLTDTYNLVAAAGKRTALTLYENSWAPNHCGDGASELTPQQFSRKYVPAAVRNGLNYLLLSWYPAQCAGLPNIDVPVSTIATEIKALHSLYPNSKIGFGEIGLSDPANGRTQAKAEELIKYYYNLSTKLNMNYYVGGYFWWYFDEDALPYGANPVWSSLNAAFGYY